jgi:hypothetical protein
MCRLIPGPNLDQASDELLVNRKRKQDEGMNMKTKKDGPTNAQQTDALKTRIKNYDSGFDELTKGALQVQTDIYVLKFPGPGGARGAPHLVFIDKSLYNEKALDEKLKNATELTVVFVIRLLDYTLMEVAEIEKVKTSKPSRAKTLFLQLLKGRARFAKKRGKPPCYYPIGVGFKPRVRKGATEAQIHAAAVFCHHARPFLDGKSMQVVFAKGGTLNHLHNYKLMVQSDDGTIGSIDPGTGHTNAS